MFFKLSIHQRILKKCTSVFTKKKIYKAELFSRLIRNVSSNVSVSKRVFFQKH